MRTYYTLVERDAPGKPWSPQFGDYDRETVEAERSEYRDKDIRAGNLKIISSGDRGEDVLAAVAKLNADLPEDDYITHLRRNADRIDGYDRDDLGESPDF